MTARPDPSDYDGPRFWAIPAGLAFLLLLIVLSLACVRRGTVCLEASHGQVDPNWARQDNVGVSVCAEVAPQGE